MSVAKTLGVLYALFGLIAGAFVSLFSMLGAAFMGSSGGSGGPFGAIFGVGAIILLPICYGLAGFIGGLIMGGLYNLVAGMTGGIEFEFTPKP